MICITSISPNHANNNIQAKAVQSWIDLGMTVYSMNSHAECQLLETKYLDVVFVPTHRTMELTYGKPYVSINAVLDYCKDLPLNNFCIINSDIELKTDKDTIKRIEDKMNDGIVLANRVNYDVNYQGSQYLAGIDIVFMNRRFLSIYPQTVFCFGQCFWDYWIPYVAMSNGIKVSFVAQNIAYHKNHAAQYQADDWKKNGRYFIWEHGLYQYNHTSEIGKMSNAIYKYIYDNAKHIEI